MSIFVIWVDREHAKLFQFSQEKMERKNLQARHTDHHTHRQDSLDDKQHEHSFFSDLSSQISEAAKVLILGPGVAKHHFQNYLIEHQPGLAKKVVGCETVDHPTDPEIAAYAKRFFGTEMT